MDWNSVQQVVRTAIQFAAGYMVSKGMLDSAGSELFIGAGMSVVAFVWWMVWNKSQAAK